MEAVNLGTLEWVADGRVPPHPVGKLDDGWLAAGEIDEFRPLEAFQHVQIVRQSPVVVASVCATICGQIGRVEDENYIGNAPELAFLPAVGQVGQVVPKSLAKFSEIFTEKSQAKVFHFWKIYANIGGKERNFYENGY